MKQLDLTRFGIEFVSNRVMYHFSEAGVTFPGRAIRYRSSPIASDVLSLESAFFGSPNVECHTSLWTNVWTLTRGHDQSIPMKKYLWGVLSLEETVAQTRIVPESRKCHLKSTHVE